MDQAPAAAGGHTDPADRQRNPGMDRLLGIDLGQIRLSYPGNPGILKMSPVTVFHGSPEFLLRFFVLLFFLLSEFGCRPDLFGAPFLFEFNPLCFPL